MEFIGDDLSGSRFRNVNLTRSVLRGVYLTDADISGEITGLIINGVEVAPLVEAELARRDPEYALISPTDADGFRIAWDVVRQRWASTVDRAAVLDPELLHSRVEDEWSLIETLRHLIFATDAWVNRVINRDPSPWHPLDLPFDEMETVDGVPWDHTARPTLAEVLTVRSSRQADVDAVLAALTDADLDRMTEPVLEPGFPRPDAYRLGDALGVVIIEEWWHRDYAERDLAVLTA